MSVRLTHPVWGKRVEPERLREKYEAVGWTAEAEVAPPEVDRTISEVLKDVGDDPAKASAALSAEESRSHPRQTLVTALARVINKQED